MNINQLKLLKGDPINLGLCNVYPLKLNEVTELGEEIYNQYLSILMTDNSLFDDYDLTKEEREELEQLTPFNVIGITCERSLEFRNLFCKSLSFFTREEVSYHPSGCFFIGDFSENRIIDEDIFDLIKTIIKKQNYLQDQEKKEFKPANDKAKELIEKMKEVKGKLQKQNKEDGLGLSDIISIVSAYSQDINIMSIWNLTIYQLYELYLRLIMWDNYHSNFMLLPHVSDNNSLDLKHWATKINLKNFKEE